MIKRLAILGCLVTSVACGADDGRPPLEPMGGDPIVSCGTTKMSMVGDCDPNWLICELDDGGRLEFDGATCR